MAITAPNFVMAILVLILLISSHHFTATKSETTGFSLKLIPMFSPQSPLYPGDLTQSQKIQKLVEMSIARADYLVSQHTKLEPENIHLPIHEYRGYYSVEVSLGTPPRNQFLLMDTGSGLIWTQCTPRVNWFDQSTPIFNTSSSSSYRTLPCDHPICRSLYSCVNGKCVYDKRYAGNGITKGVISTETFTFPINNAIPVIFGCSQDSTGIRFNGKISGIIGLNTALDSFTTQLSSIIKGRFSYCLVDYSSGEMSATSFLRFGEEAVIRSRNFKSIPIIVQTKPSTHYHLDLLDISVGSTRLRFPPQTFSIRRDGTGGCIIDSGSGITFFERGPYEAIMKEFDKHFGSYKLQRIRVVGEQMEYCYRQRPGFQAYARMTFHFRGADFVVESTYMYLHRVQGGYFCVALLSTNIGKNILGAWQQQDTRFVFDINAGVVRFVPANCKRDG